MSTAYEFSITDGNSKVVTFLNEQSNEYNTINNKHDTGYKYLFSSKKAFIQLLKSFVKQEWVESIDEASVIRIDKSFILQDFSGKEADLIYKINLKDKEIIFYLLLEFQSTVDFQMPFRLLLYMVEIWRSIILNESTDNTKGKDYKIPVIIPCVLYNGANNWTACNSFGEYQNGFDEFKEYALDFKYILFDVNRYNKEELKRLSNLIGSVFYMDRKDISRDLMSRLRDLADTFVYLDEEETQLFKVWLLKILAPGLSDKAKKQVEEIINKGERLNDMISNIEIELKEMRKQSENKGKLLGIAEGKAEGILDLLMDLGKVPCELEKQIMIQTDLNILSRWLKCAARARSIDEFKQAMN